jgi:hypothetical protein
MPLQTKSQFWHLVAMAPLWNSRIQGDSLREISGLEKTWEIAGCLLRVGTIPRSLYPLCSLFFKVFKVDELAHGGIVGLSKRVRPAGHNHVVCDRKRIEAGLRM